MEMRENEFEEKEEQIRKGYEDKLQGYIFMAIQDDRNLVINENKKNIICNAKDFWKVINISVMDIEAENQNFKKCEYINDTLIFEYNNRIIEIKNAK